MLIHVVLTIAESEQGSDQLPRDWNASSTYAFKYAHPQSSMQHLLKVGRLGDKAVVFALALGDDKTTSFDIPVKDYISASSFPLPDNPTNLSDALRELFISTSRLNDLVSLFKVNVIQRLAPGLQKEGYDDSRQESRRAPERERQPQEEPPARDPLRDDRLPEPARPYPFDDPLAAPPRRPIPAGDFAPPGFEDEYEVNRPPRGYHPGYGEGRPFNIGERDLYPPGLGPHDPLRGHFGPGQGGGMHPTFDDPLFGGDGGEGQGADPQVPPGARYDPVGPGDGRPMGRGRGSNFPRGGRGGGGFGGFGGFGGPGGFGGDII